MKERPILFSAPMVRAILEGRKTQTRRVVKRLNPEHPVLAGEAILRMCPYGQPGDRLWVRETFAYAHNDDGVPQSPERFLYAATENWEGRSVPSIHMPRRASRITLEIVAVRVERLNQMQAHDAMREGIVWNKTCGYTADGIFGDRGNPVTTFYYLWEQLNGLGSWQTNPWVWVIEFKKLTA
ncbi:hypothetical protein UFOVP315_26 [uncultured Caudovirales phage]|uniref:ASCH domain containing protein n=1 Tax=uncultured Caudovirales phage TaxID=2100421 RepID=A0A6J5LV62_9CAUD|nr:hypothetical protein UFOVP315_26 [uncultured Caudovirales phage]